MKNNKVIKFIPIIIAIIIFVIVVVIIWNNLSASKKNIVHVTETAFGNIVLDLGEWEGEEIRGTQFFTATLYDIEGFKKTLLKHNNFDEKLQFNDYSENGEIIRERYFFVVDNRAFSVNITENVVNISSLEDTYHINNRYIWAILDAKGIEGYNSVSKEYDTPCHWLCKEMSLEDIAYLYQKFDQSYYKIEDEAIYIKGLVETFDEEESFTGYSFTNEYSFKIYLDENKDIVVFPIV